MNNCYRYFRKASINSFFSKFSCPSLKSTMNENPVKRITASLSTISSNFSDKKSDNINLLVQAEDLPRLFHVGDSNCDIELPGLKSDNSHTVTVHFNSLIPGEVPTCWPEKYNDVWDEFHVRMPCSSHNLYPITQQNGEKKLEKRWKIIQEALSAKLSSSKDIESAILKINERYKNKWRFEGLHSYFNQLDSNEKEDVFTKTLPFIQSIALDLPNICTQSLPLLVQQKKRSITLSQKQICSLLANAFFCTFPRRNATKHAIKEFSTYPDINFNNLFSYDDAILHEKLNCLFHYFNRLSRKMSTGTVSFIRQVCRDYPDFKSSKSHLPKLHVKHDGTIEDAYGMLQVDFANKYLGGGVLNFGCVQEEIRFLICPELMASMIFTQSLDPNESLIIVGAERYSRYSGYADSFSWENSYFDQTPRDLWQRRSTHIVAIDAKAFSHNTHVQYDPEWMKRDIRKAIAGFLPHELCGQSTTVPAVATGNWGCGAFGGDVMLKFCLQIIAAGMTGREVCYFTFGDSMLANNIEKLYGILVEKNINIGQLWKMLVYYDEYINTGVNHKNLFAFIYQLLKNDGDSTSSNDDNSNRSIHDTNRNTNDDVMNFEGMSSNPESLAESTTMSNTSNVSKQLFTKVRTNIKKSSTSRLSTLDHWFQPPPKSPKNDDNTELTDNIDIIHRINERSAQSLGRNRADDNDSEPKTDEDLALLNQYI